MFSQGISIDPKWISSIEQIPEPCNVHQVHLLLGVFSFCQSFISGYSKITAPLYKLLKKGELFQWSQAQQMAKQKLTQALLQAPCLAYPDPNADFRLYTNALGFAIGAALTQDDKKGEHPICFISRTLTGLETRYPVYEWELLAVVYTVKKLRTYLYSCYFLLFTNNTAVKHLLNKADPNSRISNWIMLLAEHKFTV